MNMGKGEGWGGPPEPLLKVKCRGVRGGGGACGGVGGPLCQKLGSVFYAG